MQKQKVFLLVVVILTALLASCAGGTSQQSGNTPIAPVTGNTQPASSTITPAATTESALAATSEGTTGEATGTPAAGNPAADTTSTPVATASASTADGDTGSVNGSFLTSKVLNQAVTGAADEQIGTIQGLIVEPETGKVRYVVMGYGTEGKMVLAPWTIFQRGRNNTLSLTDVSTEQVAAAPAFDDQVFQEYNTSPNTLDTSVEEYWSGIVPSSSSAPVTGSSDSTATPAAADSAPTSDTTQTPEAGAATTTITPAGSSTGFVYIKPFTNIAVRNAENNILGLINDLVISPEGVVNYAVMTADPALNAGPGQIPLPWNAFSFNPQGGTFTLNIDPNTLADAPRLDVINIPDMSETGWDQQWQTYWKDIVVTTPTP